MIDISDLIGIPFVDFGRDTKHGLDCYGLAIEVEKRLGKTLKDVIPEKLNRAKVEKLAPTLNLKKIELDEIKEGVLLEFYGVKDKRPHVAVALDKNTFIHATENQGVRISSFSSARQYIELTNAYEVI
jgi:cell wall-associated NlpC family hydrolase